MAFGVTIQMKPRCLYFHVVVIVSKHFKKGNLLFVIGNVRVNNGLSVVMYVQSNKPGKQSLRVQNWH